MTEKNKYVDANPNVPVKTYEQLENEALELFKDKYGIIEVEEDGFFFKGNQGAFYGHAKNESELAYKIKNWLINSEHVKSNAFEQFTEDGELICGMECQYCEHKFVEEEDCYRINDMGDYLCESCHSIKFPTERSWSEYMLEDYELESTDGELITCTQDVMNKLSDKEIEELLVSLMESDIDYAAYYTTAG